MPYIKFKRAGKYCTKNIRTGRITRYSSEEKRDTGIRLKEAFAHGFKPTGKIPVIEHKRKGKTVKKHSRKR